MQDVIPINFTEENDPWKSIRKQTKYGWGLVRFCWGHAIPHLARWVYIEESKDKVFRFGCTKCCKHWSYKR